MDTAMQDGASAAFYREDRAGKIVQDLRAYAVAGKASPFADKLLAAAAEIERAVRDRLAWSAAISE